MSMSSTNTSLTECLESLEMTDSEDLSIEHWKDAPHLQRKVNKILTRPPRVQGHLQLFGFMVSEEQLLKLANIAFKHMWPGRKPHDRATMLFNACSYVQDSLRIPQCFRACAKIPPGMEVPPECLVKDVGVRILALWADCDPDTDCPWPGHAWVLRKKIGRLPRWWVDYDPEHFWRDI